MRRIGLFLLLAIGLGLGACTSGSLPATATASSPVRSPTPGTFATDPHIPTRAQALTATPSPTHPATPTLAVASLVLPGWMQDPAQNILMYRNYEDDWSEWTPTVYFLNPATGERFTLEMPDTYACWHDSTHAVFIDTSDPISRTVPTPPTVLTVLDLSEGSLTGYADPDPLFNTYDSPAGTCYSYAINEPESDYDITIDWVQEELPVVVTDRQTGESQVLTDPHDGILDGDAVISPGDRFAAVLQGTDDEHFDGFSMIGNRLAIYNLRDRSLVAVYQDESIRRVTFLPDGRRLIYMRGIDTPCVVDIELDERNCIHQIPSRFPGEDIVPSGFTSEPVRLIFYHYAYDDGHYVGGLCFYDLLRGTFHCPVDGLDLLQDRNVSGYLLSPDEQYIALILDDSCVDCDMAGGNMGLAVMDYDGNSVLDLGPWNVPHPMAMMGAWRPFSTGEVNR
jgi:hypothetical protein